MPLVKVKQLTIISLYCRLTTVYAVIIGGEVQYSLILTTYLLQEIPSIKIPMKDLENYKGCLTNGHLMGIAHYCGNIIAPNLS
jgi:hypothetical protein